jgi:hypothetical protein
MNLEQSAEWELTGETKILGEKLSQRHFVQHISHMTWPGLEPGPSWWESYGTPAKWGLNSREVRPHSSSLTWDVVANNSWVNVQVTEEAKHDTLLQDVQSQSCQSEPAVSIPTRWVPSSNTPTLLPGDSGISACLQLWNACASSLRAPPFVIFELLILFVVSRDSVVVITDWLRGWKTEGSEFESR